MMRRVNVLFCGSGWRLMVDFIRERLPPGISIRARRPASTLRVSFYNEKHIKTLPNRNHPWSTYH